MADFRHEYGVGLYEVTPFEAYELIRQLPQTSRTFLAENPGNEWVRPEAYLSLIDLSLRQWLWANSDKSKRGPEPEAILPDALRKEKPRKGAVKDLEPLPIEELERKLGAKRVPVT